MEHFSSPGFSFISGSCVGHAAEGCEFDACWCPSLLIDSQTPCHMCVDLLLSHASIAQNSSLFCKEQTVRCVPLEAVDNSFP